jgi:spermidine synthase
MTKKRRQHPRRLPVCVAPEPDGRLTLQVGGVVQSIYLPIAPGDDGEWPAEPAGGYWAAMLPEACPRRALLLGLGGGTVARLLARRCAGVAIVGVERDEAVLAAARGELWLDEVPGLAVVLADAFEWVPAAAGREPGGYDFACLDLFEAGRLAAGALATPFLRQVAALLAPDGTLAANLMLTGRTPEQVHRLQRVYRVLRTIREHGNLVVHLRPLRAGEAGAEGEAGAPADGA